MRSSWLVLLDANSCSSTQLSFPFLHQSIKHGADNPTPSLFEGKEQKSSNNGSAHSYTRKASTRRFSLKHHASGDRRVSPMGKGTRFCCSSTAAFHVTWCYLHPLSRSSERREDGTIHLSGHKIAFLMTKLNPIQDGCHALRAVCSMSVPDVVTFPRSAAPVPLVIANSNWRPSSGLSTLYHF